MFGSIGTMNAPRSEFNNRTGDIIHTRDPSRQVYPPSGGINSEAMFGEVKRLNANGSRFNNVVGNQYNVGYRSSQRIPATYTPSVDQGMPLPNTAPRPAEARMFGRVDHMQSENGVFNNTVGDEINIQGQAAPSPPPQNHSSPVYSRSKFLSAHNVAPHHERPAPDPEMPDFNDTTPGVSMFVLKTLQGAAQLSPVPPLSEAAGIALTILACVQGSQDNFARLVSYACKVIYLVVLAQKKHEREGRKLAPELVHHLVDLGNILTRELQLIEKSVLKGNKRKRYWPFSTPKLDDAETEENRAKLPEALAKLCQFLTDERSSDCTPTLRTA